MSPTAAGLLTIDCGNSTLDCLRHADGARLVLPAGAVDRTALRQLVAHPAVRSAYACTVVSDGLRELEPLLAARGAPLRVAGRDFTYPLRLDYLTPATLGADRWVGAYAAFVRHGRAIVVDCGTATTVNLVEACGTFRGGAIGPGLRAFVAGLAAVTPALPTPDLDADPELPPRSSQAAVDCGVVLGWCGLVERLVAGTLAAAAGPAHVVVTGGNATRLLRHARLRAQHVPDLVHQGLLALAEQVACGS